MPQGGMSQLSRHRPVQVFQFRDSVFDQIPGPYKLFSVFSKPLGQLWTTRDLDDHCGQFIVLGGAGVYLFTYLPKGVGAIG
jgi:hypothetical protein